MGEKPPETAATAPPAALGDRAPLTVIVLGAERSGTSMMARALHECGVFMGDDLDETYQNPHISRLLFEHVTRPGDSAPVAALAARIALYDRERPVWGFKYAGIVAPELYGLFRNPRFIMVARDPVAAAVRVHVAERRDILHALRRIREQQDQVIGTVLSGGRPVWPASYEEFLEDPQGRLREVLRFLGLAPAPEAVRRAALGIRPSPKKYVESVRAAPFEFFIRAHSTAIEGWARDAEDARPIRYEVFVDGALAGKGEADLFREDLLKAGVASGNHGLFCDIPGTYLDGHEHAVQVRFYHEDELAGQSPVKICRLGMPYGVVEKVDARGASGWMWNPADPEEHPRLFLEIEGVIAASASADAQRGDLRQAGMGEGDYGFFLEYPNLDAVKRFRIYANYPYFEIICP